MGKKIRYGRYIYIPQNLKKYIGNFPLVFKSKWERNFAIWLDLNPRITQWSYERSIIWYFDTNSKRRKRYYPDFDITIDNKKKYLIEIKPSKETKSSRKKNVFDNLTFERNSAKWEAARKYCEKLGKTFKIITEKELFSMGVKKI